MSDTDEPFAAPPVPTPVPPSTYAPPPPAPLPTDIPLPGDPAPPTDAEKEAEE